ncbi:MAG: Transposase Tn5 dimerization domain, partial [Verrucomicrobiales bacterium]|nr:Transposase Tn5 dimerization domain [Verrucomicrobiales bacterium]
FLARKGDRDPGPMTIWSGLLRLNDYSTGFYHALKLMGNA